MNPKISVVMSVYNAEKNLRESIESILNQTFADFEFIIVNDGSTDSSLKIINSYDDARIRIVDNKENIGLTKSLNKAIKKANGEYIARQDADDISLSNRLEEQIKYLENHPEVALLGTSFYVINGSGETIEQRKMHPNPKKSMLKGNRFVHGSVMFRKSVIEELGAYNETLKYSQDYELWLRISRKYDIRNLRDPLYMLRFHKGSISADKIGKQQMCAVLARKNVFGELKEEELRTREPMEFYEELSKEDKIAFHKAVAIACTQIDDLEAVREECINVLKLKPLDSENIIQLFSSFFGLRGIRATHQIYRYLRYIAYKLFKIQL